MAPAQPGVDGGRGDLPGADRLHGGARAVLRVSAGEHARYLVIRVFESATMKPWLFSTPLPSRIARSVP